MNGGIETKLIIHSKKPHHNEQQNVEAKALVFLPFYVSSIHQVKNELIFDGKAIKHGF
jgi:hypothetical protein